MKWMLSGIVKEHIALARHLGGGYINSSYIKPASGLAQNVTTNMVQSFCFS